MNLNSIEMYSQQAQDIDRIEFSVSRNQTNGNTELYCRETGTTSVSEKRLKQLATEMNIAIANIQDAFRAECEAKIKEAVNS